MVPILSSRPPSRIPILYIHYRFSGILRANPRTMGWQPVRQRERLKHRIFRNLHIVRVSVKSSTIGALDTFGIWYLLYQLLDTVLPCFPLHQSKKEASFLALTAILRLHYILLPCPMPIHHIWYRKSYSYINGCDKLDVQKCSFCIVACTLYNLTNLFHY
jgi:hypothetical protein